jgi:hypothetical protein
MVVRHPEPVRRAALVSVLSRRVISMKAVACGE